jgi:hypothetical protein
MIVEIIAWSTYGLALCGLERRLASWAFDRGGILFAVQRRKMLLDLFLRRVQYCFGVKFMCLLMIHCSGNRISRYVSSSAGYAKYRSRCERYSSQLHDVVSFYYTLRLPFNVTLRGGESGDPFSDSRAWFRI